MSDVRTDAGRSGPVVARRPLWRRVGLAVLILLTLASFSPVISLALALGAATLLGCTLDVGSAHPCIVAGADWGDVLYTAQILGWFTFITWPGIVVSGILWACLMAYSLWAAMRSRRP